MTDIKKNKCPYNLVCASTILKVNGHKEGVHFQNVKEFNIFVSKYMRFALSCTLESCLNWYQQQPAAVSSKTLHTEVELGMEEQGRSRLSPYSCACASHFRDPFWIHSTIAAPALIFHLLRIHSCQCSPQYVLFKFSPNLHGFLCLFTLRETRERERAAKWLEIFCQTQMVSWLLFQPTCVCLWSCGCCGHVCEEFPTLSDHSPKGEFPCEF